MISTLAKIRADTKEIELSSLCFFNELELKQMGITIDKPFKQNGKEFIYKLIKGD